MYIRTNSSDQFSFSGAVSDATSAQLSESGGNGRAHPRVTYSHGRLAVLRVVGEIDTATAPRVRAVLWPRPHSALIALALDLREVTFLGVAGLELLADACVEARHRHMGLGVINTTRVVERALQVGGLDSTVPCYSSIEAARIALLGDEVSALSGQA